jgi:hypothetical protein
MRYYSPQDYTRHHNGMRHPQCGGKHREAGKEEGFADCALHRRAGKRVGCGIEACRSIQVIFAKEQIQMQWKQSAAGTVTGF